MISVINLPDAAHRRSTFEQHAKVANTTLEWSFFPASRQLHPELVYDERLAVIRRGRKLHLRELACYSSHYALWRSFLETDKDQLLVLEDDVVLDWAFMQRLLSLDLGGSGIHYLKVFNKNMTPYQAVSNDFLGRWLIDCRGFAYGAQAYVLTRTGAARFLKHCQQVSRPIDDELDRSWAHGIPNLSVFPSPAFEQLSPSSIGAERDTFEEMARDVRALNVMVRLQEKLRRGWQKVSGYGLCDSIAGFPSRSWKQQPRSIPS